MTLRTAPTGRAAAITEIFRSTLDAIDRLDDDERDAIYRGIVADLRERRPECVSPLEIGEPTEPNVDPRAPGGAR